MKKLLLLFVLIITSCQTTTKITEKEVMDSFDNFFDTVDNNLDQFGSIVTDDFFIYENSRRYSKDEFIEFVSGFDIIETKRDFKDIVIDTDINSAHISLNQTGEFIVNTPDGKVKMNFNWLESAYLVKENNILKYKFYFSEAIENSTTKIED
tara:strand:- start:143 stop:598 length:456 start_codon:yes stop_codon:yes gene_type:complete